MKKLQTILLVLISIFLIASCSQPTGIEAIKAGATGANKAMTNHQRVLVGYWENWDATIHSAGHIPLNDINSQYNVLCVAFPAVSHDGVVSMEDNFDPARYMDNPSAAEIAQAQAEGRKILISLGGAEVTVDLSVPSHVDNFVTSMIDIINTYGYDGMDIDIEHGITGTDPAVLSASQQGLVNAINRIMDAIPGLWLTMAPETAYVTGGYSNYGGPWGAYLPIIEALRDRITYIHVQYYNSGGMNGLDGKGYTQGTADFIVSQTELVLQGFQIGYTSGVMYNGLRQDQVAIGLPAINGAAGGGYTQPAEVKKALDYLIYGEAKNFGGQYKLVNPNGYPSLRGVMTWSANWDASNNYLFANSHGPYLAALPQVVPPTPTSTPDPNAPTPTPTATPDPSIPQPWAVGNDYVVGSLVTHGGVTYICTYKHTAITGWEPDKSPSLWQVHTGPAPTPTSTPVVVDPTPTNTPVVVDPTPTNTPVVVDPTPTNTPVVVDPTPTATQGQTTYPAWDSSEIYTGGDRVSHNGSDWKAKWWTTGEEPGTTGQWGVWEQL